MVDISPFKVVETALSLNRTRVPLPSADMKVAAMTGKLSHARSFAHAHRTSQNVSSLIPKEVFSARTVMIERHSTNLVFFCAIRFATKRHFFRPSRKPILIGLTNARTSPPDSDYSLIARR